MNYRGRSSHNFGYAKPNRRVLLANARRTSRARKIDGGLRAPLARTSEQWLNAPNRFDIAEVDTPKKTKQKEEPRRTFEPQRISHSQFKQRLAMHRYYGTGR